MDGERGRMDGGRGRMDGGRGRMDGGRGRMDGGRGRMDGGRDGGEREEGWRGEGGERWMEGEGKGLMEGEGKGLIEGMWCWALSPCLGRRSSRRSRRISPLSTGLRVLSLWCPRSLLVPCLHRRVVVLCCNHASFSYVVVAHNEQR